MQDITIEMVLSSLIIKNTDNDGNKVTYIVYNTYVTTPEDFDYATRPTEGRREISLTTCTDDVKSRLIVWASAD